MEGTAVAHADELIRPAELTAWLDANLPELGDGPLGFDILAGGATNAVFRIDRGGKSMVLRRPPARLRPDSEKIMVREARVLGALNGTDVPAPRFHALCEDRDVLGAAFYVMEMVDGWLYTDKNRARPAPYDQAGEARRGLAFELAGGIAKLSTIDYKAVGLDGFGKPDGFLERQVGRWKHQLESYRTLENYELRPLPDYDYVTDWLSANVPSSYRIGIIHGDYGFANALFDRGPIPKLAAMIDWELSTIGDPLLDLGWISFGLNSRDGAIAPSGYIDPSDFPYREEVVEHYEAVSGRKVEHLTYYMVLAQFKLATLLERHYARYLNGSQSKEIGVLFAEIVLRLMTTAGKMARAHG